MIAINVDIELGEQSAMKSFHLEWKGNSKQFITVYGPSGEGKTTFLRALAGLEKPTSGRIEIEESIWFDSSTGKDIPVQERKLGMVFQNHRLFPNFTVAQNLQFAIKGKDCPILELLISKFELKELLHARPNSLSGGQTQRVAIAQALVQLPKLLLLDEAFSALDSITRNRMQEALCFFKERLDLTVIMVNHDLHETLKLSDTVLLIEKGVIVKSGTPSEVFQNQVRKGKSSTGKLLELKQENGYYLCHVLIGNQIVQLKRKMDQSNQLKLGDSIDIEVS